MSTARQKDLECSCHNKLFLTGNEPIDFVDTLDKDKRYEIWENDKQISYLEYIDSENRWYFFTRSVELTRDENGNAAINTLELGGEPING